VTVAGPLHPGLDVLATKVMRLSATLVAAVVLFAPAPTGVLAGRAVQLALDPALSSYMASRRRDDAPCRARFRIRC
jgi:hypothetical protein